MELSGLLKAPAGACGRHASLNTAHGGPRAVAEFESTWHLHQAVNGMTERAYYEAHWRGYDRAQSTLPSRAAGHSIVLTISTTVHHFLLRRAARGKCLRTWRRTRRACATAFRDSARGGSGPAPG